jgi:hypothetical protein
MEIIWAALIGGGATLAATILSYYFKAKHDYNHKHQLLKDHVDQNANVYTALEFTMKELGCDRVHVFEFHNGDTYYSGGSQQKFSSTYEVVRDGISSECTRLQNLRISNFNTLVKDVINDDIFACSDIEKIKSGTERNHLKRQGVKSVYSFPVKTLTGKVVGILSIDYVSNFKNLDEKSLKFLKNQSVIISGYVCSN